MILPAQYDIAAAALGMDAAELRRLVEGARTEALPKFDDERRSAFIEAVLNVALKRQQGYAARRHGDVLNKECMDEVVELCAGMAKAALSPPRQKTVSEEDEKILRDIFKDAMP